jgi:hypothetical protein
VTAASDGREELKTVTVAPRLRTPLPAVLLLGAGLLAGCSGSGGAAASAETDAAATGTEQSGTPQTVECPGKATAVDLPAQLPAPLPDGTVVVAVQQRSGGRTVVTGVVPAAESAVLKQLQGAYRTGGLHLTEGETEEHDAESNFTGTGVTGRWGIRALSDCSPEATRIDLVVRKG